MYLTREEVFQLPPEAFKSVFDLCNAVYTKFACGISTETAARIIRDYNAR